MYNTNLGNTAGNTLVCDAVSGHKKSVAVYLWNL